MTANIISALLPFAIKILSMYFESKDVDLKSKKEWKQFLERVQSKPSTSVRLKKSVDAQLDRLRKQI